jgi:hypothetical protein
LSGESILLRQNVKGVLRDSICAIEMGRWAVDIDLMFGYFANYSSEELME